MNVDVTEQSPQQAVQNQQQAQQEEEQQQQQEKPAVVALLISPSTASSPTSTVSPTASSISKNSSTDEVDETTAEADHPHSAIQEQERVAVAGRATDEVRVERKDHHQKDACGGGPLRQEERYQQSATEYAAPIAGTEADDQDDGDAGAMTLASASCGLLETTDNTLLAQCTPGNHVTTEKQRAAEGEDVPAADNEANALNNKMPLATEITDSSSAASTDMAPRDQELAPESDLVPATPCSSSSTSSSPASGTEQAGSAAAEAASGDSGGSLPAATVLAAANNNPMPDEDNEDEQADSSSSSNSSSTGSSSSSSSSSSSGSTTSGCSESSSSINHNDRFNNNSNNNNNSSSNGGADMREAENSSSGVAGEGKVKVGTGDNDSSRRAGLVEEEEGVRTSAATEIAPGQGEGDRVTLPNAERTGVAVLVTHSSTAPAPLERVQILPETMDHDSEQQQEQEQEQEQEQQETDAKVLAQSQAVDHNDNDNDNNDEDDDEGVGLTSTTVTTAEVGEVSEENNTISTTGSTSAIVVSGSGVEGSTSSSSSPSPSPSSTTAASSSGELGGGSCASSSSVDSSSSSTSTAATTASAVTLPSSSRSSSPTSSSESSSPSATVPQQALAEAQPTTARQAAAAAAAAAAPPPMADDRQLCDSSRKGHSFVVVVVEGQRNAGDDGTVEASPPSPRSHQHLHHLQHHHHHHPHQSPTGASSTASASMKNPAASPQLAVVKEDDDGVGGGDERGDGSRPLTLAEELSQADAASSLSSVSPSAQDAPGSAAAPEHPSSAVAVAPVLPKSAAGTAAAAAAGAVVVASSGSSRSTSPILHSSLKKSHRMGVMTGAAVTGAAAVVAAAAATATATNETRRRVSFPKDAQLITGYLDPVNPWACISVCEASELLELYRSSCKRHCTLPLKPVMEHLQSIDNSKGRVPLLSLKDQQLSYGACEALEEIFKHVQYRCIDLSHSGLDDVTASVMFDIIEYYEAANELDISDNLQMSSKSWTACINMLKKSQALNVLITRGPTISDYQATNLAKALNTSAIHTLKLEHCVLSQQPIASLCAMLKRNTVLRELWLAHNQLSCEDAQQIANLLRANFYIQLIDISNNRIGDKGVEHIVTAIVEQSVYFKDMQEKKRKSDLNFSDLSSSLNSINNGAKHYFPQRLRSSEPISMAGGSGQQVVADEDLRCPPSAITLTPPVTPPSTPALPAMETTPTTETPVDRSEKMETAQISDAGNAATMYTINQHGAGIESANDAPAPPSPAPSPPTPPADAVAPPNVNLVQTSTNNSVSLQTSDREKPATVERPAGGLVTAEEEALLLSSVGAGEQRNGERTVEVAVVKSTGGEIVQTERSSAAATTLEDESFELLLSTETTPSDSPVPQAPKKARLAKQDSVLSEFEATLEAPVAMDTGTGNTTSGSSGVETEHKPKHETNSSSSIAAAVVAKETPKVTLMEEDVSELCADYDDDGSNLRISQENLFVDLGIPAVCEEGEDTERATTVVAPLKKDELQLLIEKSQKVEDQLEAAVEAQEVEVEEPVKVPAVQKESPPAGVVPQTIPVRTRKSAISSDDRQPPLPSMPIEAPKKDRTHSSSSDCIAGGGATGVGGGLRMVEVQIKDSVPLSRSLDSVTGGDESDFESCSPFMTTAPSSFPNERSFSSESLNSETSIDSNDSKSSLKIIESKFAAKNGTLERQQQSSGNRESTGGEQTSNAPAGLQVLVLWNNEITRNSVRHFSRLLEKTSTLDTLNVGSNLLCNNFVAGIGAALKANGSLTNLGLQGAHLSDKGAKAMAEVIEFGGNATLQRIDLRNNNIQKAGLEALNEAMKSNKSVTRIDLDDTPRRVKDTSLDGVGSEYSRLLNNIRAQCERNKNPPEPSEPISTSVKRARANYLSSRKISLTCPSIKTSPSAISGADKQHLLDPSGCKKTPPGTAGSGGGRLRSPLPSPIPSPIASPVPSPSRNRFHVSRVTDGAPAGTGGPSGSTSSPSPSSTGSSPTLFFPSNSRFRVVTVAEPDLKSANNRNSGSTISLPMTGSKSSPSVSPSLSIAGGCVGGTSSSMGAVHRRPVCSSAPTLSSFPSPLSPLAAVPTTMGVRPMAPSPAPLLPVVTPISNTFHTMLPTPIVVPTLVGPTLVNNLPMPLQPPNVTQILPPHQHQFLQQLPPVAPMLPQQQQQGPPPQGYHFVTAYGSASSNNTPMMLHQVTKHTAASPLPQTTVHLQQQQQQQQQTSQYTSAYPPTKMRHPSTPHQYQQHHSSSSNSSTLHDSVLSSTSIESPDLEVKRFMSGGAGGGGSTGGAGILDDSCCSSISSSSIDSIDNPNFVSTSISSTDESFDLVVSSPPLAGSACSSFSIVPLHTATTTASSRQQQQQQQQQQEDESTLIARSTSGMVGGKVPTQASLSTSSIGGQLNTATATSSQESLYDVHDLSASSNSSLSGCPTVTNWMQLGPGGVKQAPPPGGLQQGTAVHHAAPPAAAGGLKVAASSNSNESTLTSVQSLEREAVPVKAVSEKAPRVRKTSWILGGGGGAAGGGGSAKHTDSGSSGGSTPTPSGGGGGSGYTPAIEKLLSIFHNPSNLFSSSKASSASPPPPAPATNASDATASGGGSQPPSRKESPMSGLFHHWVHGSNSSNSTSPTSAKKEDDQQRSGGGGGGALLKVNVSPESTLTPQQLQPLQNQAQLHYHQLGPAVQQSVEHMPPQLKVEMKENISPENTITHKLLSVANAPPPPSPGAIVGEPVGSTTAAISSPAMVAPVVATPHTKVIFQLGGDYDESEDDIETLTNKYGNNASLGGMGGQYLHHHHQLHQSGPSSLLGGSTTSNSSGISIGSGTSAGELMAGGGMMMGPSPTPSGSSGGGGQTASVSSDTVLVLSHLGQLARDSLSMFKNPSLTSQDSISIRSMDSLVEMAIDVTKPPTGGAAGAAAATSVPTQPQPHAPQGTHHHHPPSASASSPSSLGRTSSSSPTPPPPSSPSAHKPTPAQ